MKSPAVEWTLGIGYLAFLDYVRARGEADGDTASEVVRELVARHPIGRPAFAAVVAAGAYAFHRHIVNPLNIKET